MDKRTYSQEEIDDALAVVAGQRGNVSAAARLTGMPVTTLSQYSRGIRQREKVEKSKADRESLTSINRLRLSRSYAILARKALVQAQSQLSEASAWEAARISALAADHFVSLSGNARPSEGPGVTVSLAQYFQSALPTTKTVTVTPIGPKDDAPTA